MKHLPLAVAVAFTLAGCGGGGSSSTGSNNTGSGSQLQAAQPPVGNKTSNSGSIDAAFVAGAKPRYMLNGIAVQSSGNASPLTQGTDGAVTAMGTYSISGSPIATQEISGNASYAQGRWTVGAVSNGASTIATMDGSSNDAYHYVVYNGLAALPASGTLTCGAGKFTNPTYTGGTGGSPGKDAYAGSATGTAAITFDGNGGHVAMTVSATVLGSSGTANFSGSVLSASSMYISGGVGGSGNNAMVSLGDAGNGAVNVVVIYSVVLANKNTYDGSAIFTCK